MRRAEDEADELAGHDSFLDVVTNIVGILILLVMVVGLRTSHAVATSATAEPADRGASSSEAVRQAEASALHAEREARDLIRRAVGAQEEVLIRERERDVLQMALARAEQELAARRAKLSAEDQQDFDLRRQLTEAELTLEELMREQMSLLPEEPELEEIECQPTPIARTVTGKEVHVLLGSDHLAIVPFDELLDLMKNDARANVWRLRQEDELDRTIGPIAGFRLRYWFVKTPIVARGDGGTIMTGQMVRFSRCYLLPIAKPPGEPAEEALRSGSEFWNHLQRLRPGTTVTIWTYPGNYERLRDVKRTVRDFGLAVAVRPLPEGMPIGASSSGSDTVSE